MQNKRTYRKAPVEAHNEMRMRYLGHLLREFRKDTQLSRVDFAEEYGISRSLIERIEDGKVVTVHSLFRYMDCLHVEPETVFVGVE